MKEDRAKLVFIIPLCILLFAGGCAHIQKEAPPTADEDNLKLVMTSTGYSWVAMRYNQYTGEAWFQFPYHWRTIGEKKTLAKSDYLIRMVGFGGIQWMAIRIDKRTGRCWEIKDSCWIELGTNISLDSDSGTFNLEMTSFETGWEAILYNENTGQAWLYSENLWRPIEEMSNPRVSKYTIKMVGDSEYGWLAIRMEKKSNNCWMTELKNEFCRWVDMEMVIRP